METSPEPQSRVQSTTGTPFTLHQQVSPRVALGAENVVNAGLPSTQRVMTFIADRYFQVVNPSTLEELNGFVQYLRDVRNLLIVDTQQGSLIITLECRSLQILEDLWEDYCSGHLNEMAQKYLVTEELLEEFGFTTMSTIKLTTTILGDEYTSCRQYFLQSAGKNLEFL